MTKNENFRKIFKKFFFEIDSEWFETCFKTKILISKKFLVENYFWDIVIFFDENGKKPKLKNKIAELVRSVGTGGLELGRSVGQRAFELEVSFTILFVVNASSYIRCPTLRPSSKPPVPTLRTSSAILFLNFGFLPFSSKNDYVPEITFNEKIFRNQDFRFKTCFKPF